MAEDTPQNAGTEGAGAEQGGGVDSGVAELTSDFFGDPSQPAGISAQEEGEEQSQEQAAAEPAAEAAPGQPQAAAEAPKPPKDPTIEIDGRRMKRSEWKAEFERLKTTAEQFPHIQRKYTDLLEQQRQPRMPEQPQGAPRPTGPSPAQIQAATKPLVDQAVKDGHLSEEFAAGFPGEAAQLVFYRELIHDARDKVARMETFLTQGSQVVGDQQVLQQIDSNIEQLSKSDPFFAPLAQPEVRQAYYAYLRQEVDPVAARMLGPEGLKFLGKQFAAFISDQLRQSAQQQAQVEAGRQANNRRLAVGEGGAPRPASPPADAWSTELASIAGVPDRLFR